MSVEGFIEVCCPKCGSKRAVFPQDPEEVTCYSCGHTLEVARPSESASGGATRIEAANQAPKLLPPLKTRVLRGVLALAVISAVFGGAFIIIDRWSIWFAEWRRSNPPVWAYLDSTEEVREYINTHMVAPLSGGKVAVLIKHVTRTDTKQGLAQKESESSFWQGKILLT
jgi:ribosomal protein S27E